MSINEIHLAEVHRGEARKEFCYHYVAPGSAIRGNSKVGKLPHPVIWTPQPVLDFRGFIQP